MAVFGETLRQARAYKGVTLKEAEQATRINRHHLAALEDENFAALPPLIYQRGIVRNYATYLELDPNKLLTMFEDAHGSASAPTDVVIAPKPLDMPSNFTPNFAIIAFLCVLSAILFAWLYSAYRGPVDAVPTSTVPVTVTPLAARAEMDPISPTATATATAEPDEADGTPEAEADEPEEVALADEAENSRPLSRANLRRTEVAESATQATTEAGASEPEAVDAEAADQVNVPAATVGPTNTPTVTPTPDVEATQTAEAVATEEAVAAVAATQEALLTISFAPTSYIWLTVVADGVEVFNNEVNAGEVVGPFDAVSFDVYTSDASSTYITNHDEGTTFTMGTNSFPLP